jgi:hypothetical protein
VQKYWKVASYGPRFEEFFLTFARVVASWVKLLLPLEPIEKTLFPNQKSEIRNSKFQIQMKTIPGDSDAEVLKYKLKPLLAVKKRWSSSHFNG